MLEQVLTKIEYNVILTFYNKTVHDISAVTSIPVSTVHQFQGQEADNVLVVMAPSQSGQNELYHKKEYVLAAITRARKNLTVLICDKL